MKAGETTVLKLLQGSKVFLIPNFQRRYSWRAKEWELLWADLVREYHVDHSEESQRLDGHFLGSIVLHPAAGAASVLMQHLVIDGQQRLTTILVLLAVLRDIRAELEPHWDPAEYDTKYLTNPYDADFPDRLRPTELDREAYTATTRTRTPTGGIGQAYAFFAKKVRAAVREEGLEISKLANTLLLHMLLVEINTSTGDSVNNIFNTLNSKGMPLTAADLVRNELLLHLSDDAGKAAYLEFWVPMENALVREVRGRFDDRQFITFLWSREVVNEPSATRQDLFSVFERRLRRSLDGLPAAEREDRALRQFREIFEDHKVFRLVRDPMNPEFDSVGVGPALRASLSNLRSWGSEPSTPLALWLTKLAALGEITDRDAADSIDILLSYLVRRALAGIPTNLLNRILTPIPNRLSTRRAGTVAGEFAAILSQKSFYWPSDADVLSAVPTQPIYVSAKHQTQFILSLAESLLASNDFASTAGLTVEHVMPQVLPPDWSAYLRRADVAPDDALALSQTLGNLTLIGGSNAGVGSNAGLSSASFDQKRAILAESPLQLNEQLSEYQTFLPKDIRARSEHLARVILRRYRGPIRSPLSESAEHAPDSSLADRIEAALQALPEGAWTTDSELVSFAGADLAAVRDEVNRLEPVIARLVRAPSGDLPDWFRATLREEVRAQSPHASLQDFVGADSLGELVRTIEEATNDGGDVPNPFAPYED